MIAPKVPPIALKADEHLTAPKKNARKVLSAVYTGSMICAILAVSSLSSLVQFRFDFHAIEWVGFITLTVTRMAMQFLSKYLGAEMKVQRGKESDRVKSVQEDFLSMSRSVEPSAFYEWIDEENKRAKRSAYVSILKAKISKYEKRLSHYLYEAQFGSERKYAKRIKRIKRKLNELRAECAEDKISACIDHIKVKYRPLRASDFLSPMDVSDTRIRYSVDSHKANTVDVAKGLPMTLIVSLFLAVSGMSYVFGSVNMMSMLLDLLAVGINLFIGMYVIGERTVTSIVGVFINRKAVLSRFNAVQNSEKSE